MSVSGERWKQTVQISENVVLPRDRVIKNCKVRFAPGKPLVDRDSFYIFESSICNFSLGIVIIGNNFKGFPDGPVAETPCFQ